MRYTFGSLGGATRDIDLFEDSVTLFAHNLNPSDLNYVKYIARYFNLLLLYCFLA